MARGALRLYLKADRSAWRGLWLVMADSKTPGIDKAGPVRKFSDAAIQGAIERALLPLPDNADAANVVFEASVNADGSKEIGVAFVGRKRLRDGTLSWEVAGFAGVGGEWGSHLTGGAKAKVAYAW